MSLEETSIWISAPSETPPAYMGRRRTILWKSGNSEKAESKFALGLSWDMCLLPSSIGAPGSQVCKHRPGLTAQPPTPPWFPGLQTQTQLHHLRPWLSRLQMADWGTSQPLELCEAVYVCVSFIGSIGCLSEEP